MIIHESTKNFLKKNIPDIRVGDTVKISFKITEGQKTRIQAFEGLVIAKKHGQGLDGTIKIRKISGGIGVERTFPLHSPLIVKFEKISSSKVRRAKLYFVRDLTAKQRRRRTGEKKNYASWEEAMGETELQKIEDDKIREAEAKQALKEAKEQELEDKFEQAAAAHEKVKEEKTE